MSKQRQPSGLGLRVIGPRQLAAIAKSAFMAGVNAAGQELELPASEHERLMDVFKGWRKRNSI